ncbi:MAG: flavin prenyltransferase UbiX [Bacillota bacterium]|nr:flavin prenyltransferase UbiX [Bacillota bacterium]
MRGRFIVALTGGSGAPYGLRVVQALLQGGARVDLLLSPAGRVVLAEETGWDPQGEGFSEEEVHPLTGWHRPRRLLGDPQRSFWTGGKEASGELYLYDVRDVSADIASGSTPIQAMIIAPSSMSTVAAIATGQSGNLIERAADVALKEGRRLVVMPRETPLHALHLENLLTLARLGVKVVPAMPGFYHRPKTIEDLVDFVADRLLRAAGADLSLSPSWQGLGS